MSKKDEFAFMDATEQAELVRSKQVKPIELVEAAIERIEELNPRLNAVITTMYDLAREAAEKPVPDSVFAGVPFLMKDIGALYAGIKMAMGSTILKDFVPTHDSELTIRLKKAGLITLGKTNTPEFGLIPTTEPLAFGPSRNPWDTDISTGGSSGGSSAAVASGMVPVAHANDGGGSIRIPASCCGVFGLKPNRARNPMGPDIGDNLSGLVCEHVVSQSVRDSAAILDATSGPDIGDPYWAPPPRRPYLEEVNAGPQKLRIGFSTETQVEEELHPDCKKAILNAASLCEDMGHEVVETGPVIANIDEFMQAFTVLWYGGCVSTIDNISRLSGQPPKSEQYEPLTWAIYELGSQYTASDYITAVSLLQRSARLFSRFFTDYDVFLTSVLAKPPVPIGTFDAPQDNPMDAWEKIISFMNLYTPVCNATGQPGMSVPLYWNDQGLPIGVHFSGGFGDEGTLFRLAAQLEEARPWKDKRPSVSI